MNKEYCQHGPSDMCDTDCMEQEYRHDSTPESYEWPSERIVNTATPTTPEQGWEKAFDERWKKQGTFDFGPVAIKSFIAAELARAREKSYREGYKQGKFDIQIESSTWGIPEGCCSLCAFYLDYKDDWQCNGGSMYEKCTCHPEIPKESARSHEKE